MGGHGKEELSEWSERKGVTCISWLISMIRGLLD